MEYENYGNFYTVDSNNRSLKLFEKYKVDDKLCTIQAILEKILYCLS